MNRSLVACLFVAFVCFAVTSKSANAQFNLNLNSTSTTNFGSYKLYPVVTAPVLKTKTLTFDSTTGVLTIKGSPVADQVRVQLSHGSMAVYYENSMGDFDKASFLPLEVSKIVFDGQEGDDNFRVDGHEWMHQRHFVFDCELRGGDGRDWLEGGVFNDLIVGGPGRDYLFGEDGDDELYGDSDHDYLNAGPGADLLDGGRDGYADIMVGGEGPDQFTIYRWQTWTGQAQYELENVLDHSYDGTRDTYILGE